MSGGAVNSSGNVFIGLGYPTDEAAILQMRADLMADLRKFIKAKKLTQAKAAEILGLSQSRVSDLIRGKWERFSLEMLIPLRREPTCMSLSKRQRRGKVLMRRIPVNPAPGKPQLQ